MSVTVRPYVTGGWEVDIRIHLPDGTAIRERRKAPTTSKAAAERWAAARERVLLVSGKPKPVQIEEVKEIPTLREFGDRFIDGYAKANRLKPSGIASKRSVLRIHLVPHLGEKRLDQISTEDVQRLKASMDGRAAKTVNNVLTVLGADAVLDQAAEDEPTGRELLRLRGIREVDRGSPRRSPRLSGGAVGWRSRVAMRRNHGA
jgi:hypothetical protein